MKFDTENISDKEMLEQILQIFANDTDRLWFKYSKVVNITKYSKAWQNNDYHRDLEKYRISKQLENWKNFKSIIRRTKQAFFNQKIQKISNNKLDPQELINQVKKYKLSAIEAIQYKGQPCLELDDLQQALHLLFNSAQYYQINMDLLEKLLSKLTTSVVATTSHNN